MSILGKSNNGRRYPGESNRNRPDRAQDRRDDARDRLEITNALTPKQRIERLDVKFGVGLGAVKERARLQSLIQRGNKPAAAVKQAGIVEVLETALPPEVIAEIEAMNEEGNGNKKKLKAKDRRSRNQEVN
jgi:hypothetical protein